MLADIWTELAITGPQIASVAISATALFWVFSALMAWLGQRLRLRVSITTLALMTVIGAVTARAILGDAPKMTGGLVALGVLFAWESAVRLFSRGRLAAHPPRGARAVIVDGQVNDEMLRAARVQAGELWIRLRRAGVTERAQVGYGIVEADGSITVIRRGQAIDPELLTGVAGLPGPEAVR
ncbi:MAG: DUF421 domain-containing protein [Bifidobacteriaceae bacterium]|jgi:uncharacterized membrane protein YcaP (DUF421 family)|nr:DUF421 domain-containing protein [Bifidobacteriaceae bacterium]